MRFEVIDIFGKLVTSKKIDKRLTRVSIEGMVSGMYFVKMFSQSDMHIGIQKLMVNAENNIVFFEDDNGFAAGHKGIDLQGSNNTNLKENIILFQSLVNDSTVSLHLGNNEPVAIDVSTSSGAILECNQMQGTYVGMRLNGNMSNLENQGNMFGDHNTGLRYTKATMGGGMIQTRERNEWHGNYAPIVPNAGGGAAYNAVFDTAGANIATQLYRIASTNATYFPADVYPSLATGGQDWFVSTAPGLNFVAILQIGLGSLKPLMKNLT